MQEKLQQEKWHKWTEELAGRLAEEFDIHQPYQIDPCEDGTFVWFSEAEGAVWTGADGWCRIYEDGFCDTAFTYSDQEMIAKDCEELIALGAKILRVKDAEGDIVYCCRETEIVGPRGWKHTRSRLRFFPTKDNLPEEEVVDGYVTGY